jgi:hypothetical protein
MSVNPRVADGLLVGGRRSGLRAGRRADMHTTVVPVHYTPLNLVKSFLLIGERVVIVDAGMRGGGGSNRQRTSTLWSECG